MLPTAMQWSDEVYDNISSYILEYSAILHDRKWENVDLSLSGLCLPDYKPSLSFETYWLWTSILGMICTLIHAGTRTLTRVACTEGLFANHYTDGAYGICMYICLHFAHRSEQVTDYTSMNFLEISVIGIYSIRKQSISWKTKGLSINLKQRLLIFFAIETMMEKYVDISWTSCMFMYHEFCRQDYCCTSIFLNIWHILEVTHSIRGSTGMLTPPAWAAKCVINNERGCCKGLVAGVHKCRGPG